MATYYFRNTGNTSWQVATNWSLTDGGGATGAIPTAADNAYFTSNSGPCSVAAASACLNLIFSGVGAGNYSNAITISSNLVVSGNITLSATMSIVGTGVGTLLASSATTATLTSNGVPIPCTFRPGSLTGVFTFTDNWTVTGTLTIAGGTFNGGSINAQGNINGATAAGFPSTTPLIISGNADQSWSTALRVNLNTTILKTGGTLTIGSVLFAASLTYTSGTVVFTPGTTFTLGNGGQMDASITLAVGALTFEGFNMDPVQTSEVVLAQPLYVNGTFTLGGFSRTSTINGSTIYARGASVTTLLTSGTVSGTTSLVIDGSITQTVTMPSIGTGRWCINTTFNNPNIIISGIFSYGTSGTLTALQTVTVAGGSTLRCGFGGITFNTGLVRWQNVNIFPNSSGSGPVTLGETLYADGNVILGSAAVPTIINGSDLRIYGNLTCNNTNTQISGTSTIYLEGDGPQSVSMPAAANTGAIRSNMVIDNKYVNFIGTFFYNTGTLTFLSNVIAKNSTLYINSNTTIVNAHLAVWGFISINFVTLTLNEFFSGTPDVRTVITPLAAAGYNINFTDGFEKISKFIKITGAIILNPNQLLVITDGWNKYAIQNSAVQNRGIRGINSSPNGISKNKPSTLLAGGYGLGSFLVSDPNTKSMI